MTEYTSSEAHIKETCKNLFIYIHGFGVGPKGVKFAFMQQHLSPIECETVSWHQPSYAETKLSYSIGLVEEFLLERFIATGKTWNIVGSSTGALIALEVARRHPECVNKLLLLSPAIDLASYFQAAASRHGWSRDNLAVAEEFQPNCTGDGSGPLRYEFLEDMLTSETGVSTAPCVPTFVVHSEADVLVPVGDCRAWCEKYARSSGGFVHHAHFFAPTDAEGNALDHGLYHFAKPQAVTAITFAGVLKSWFLEQES
jgi:pimeloyl-ACP methyl ester carboxylesterase